MEKTVERPNFPQRVSGNPPLCYRFYDRDPHVHEYEDRPHFLDCLLRDFCREGLQYTGPCFNKGEIFGGELIAANIDTRSELGFPAEKRW